MGKKFFITGTDTDVGKSLVAAALLHAGQKQGLKTLGLKPVAAGCEQKDVDGSLTWVNDDALLLQQYSSVKLAYEQVNPVALEQAIAPHIAAQKENKSLSLDRIAGFLRGSMMTSSDLCVVEGAGGWKVPLNTREYMSDVAHSLNLPVILVVGMRLGCLNHALLTVDAIKKDGLVLAGWVANTLDVEMPVFAENIDTLSSLIPAPCLGTLPHLSSPSPEAAAEYLDINKLYS